MIKKIQVIFFNIFKKEALLTFVEIKALVIKISDRQSTFLIKKTFVFRMKTPSDVKYISAI